MTPRSLGENKLTACQTGTTASFPQVCSSSDHMTTPPILRLPLVRAFSPVTRNWALFVSFSFCQRCTREGAQRKARGLESRRMGWEKTSRLSHLRLAGGAGVGVLPGDCSPSAPRSGSEPDIPLWHIAPTISLMGHTERCVFRKNGVQVSDTGH